MQRNTIKMVYDPVSWFLPINIPIFIVVACFRYSSGNDLIKHTTLGVMGLTSAVFLQLDTCTFNSSCHLCLLVGLNLTYMS